MSFRRQLVSVCSAVCIGVTLVMGSPSAAIAAGNDSSAAVIRGQFTQHKYLAELQQPLVSSGQFVIAAGHGLIWQIEQPLQVQLVITRQQLVQRSDGEQTTRIDADQQPALRVVTAILMAIFETDTDRLQRYFDVKKETAADGSGWTLTLQPATAGVRKFIQHVRIQGQGEAQVQHIEIQQAGGDHSEIDLQTDSDGPTTLSEKEKALFSE